MLWCSNQIVDQLAKDSADTVRFSSKFRVSLLSREQQLTDLAIYLGRLTHEANNHMVGGKPSRDSEAVKSTRRKKIISKAKPGIKEKLKASGPSESHARTSSWTMPGLCERPAPDQSFFRRGVQSLSKARRKHAQVERASREQAAFMASWRESRSVSMQPRPASLPSAQDWLNALRCRLEARGVASSSP